MEVDVKRWNKEMEEEQVAGGWVTEKSLEADGWSPCHVSTQTGSTRARLCVCACVHLRAMIEHSKTWARSRGLLTCSEVHGAEEWRIPTKRTFAWTSQKGQITEQKGSFSLEDTVSLRMRFVVAWHAGS